MRARAAAGSLLALLIGAAGCGIDFGRKITDEESLLRAEVLSYYDEVAAAFAAGNAGALAGLFDPAIAKPMTREQIRAWGDDFFKKHGPALFKIEKIDFERLGHVEAVVLLSYKVETKGGRGDFGGVERDRLIQRNNRWSVTSWEKVP